MEEILDGQRREIIRCAGDIRISIQNNAHEDTIKYCEEMKVRVSQIVATIDDYRINHKE